MTWWKHTVLQTIIHAEVLHTKMDITIKLSPSSSYYTIQLKMTILEQKWIVTVFRNKHYQNKPLVFAQPVKLVLVEMCFAVTNIAVSG